MPRLCSASDQLQVELPGRPSIEVRFPPVAGSSPDALLASSWRAHMAFALPPGVSPHVAVQDSLLAALDGRLPVPLLIDDHIALDFSVEDDRWPSRYVMADVGRFVLSLVSRSKIVVAEITYHGNQPGLGLQDDRSPGRDVNAPPAHGLYLVP